MPLGVSILPVIAVLQRPCRGSGGKKDRRTVRLTWLEVVKCFPVKAVTTAITHYEAMMAATIVIVMMITLCC